MSEIKVAFSSKIQKYKINQWKDNNMEKARILL